MYQLKGGWKIDLYFPILFLDNSIIIYFLLWRELLLLIVSPL